MILITPGIEVVARLSGRSSSFLGGESSDVTSQELSEKIGLLEKSVI